MRKASAPVLFLVGLVVVGAVAGLTFLVGSALDLGDDSTVGIGGDSPTLPDGPTSSTASTEPPLAPDQVVVTGVATGVTVEGSTLPLVPTPFTVDVAPDDAVVLRSATLRDVEVDGELTNVAWEGGRPFDLQAVGLGVIAPQLNVYASAGGITVGFLDGTVNSLAEGSYGLQTPVAVGSSGLARPQDAVAFEATVESTITFEGGAVATLPPQEATFEATGRVLLEGQLEVRDETGVLAGEQTRVELPAGPFRLTITPRPDGSGYDLEALLQGDGLVVT